MLNFKNMLYSKKETRFTDCILDATQIKSMVNPDRSIRNFCAIKMEKAYAFEDRPTSVDLASTFYKFQRELLKNDIYVSLYVSKDLPHCTFIIIHKSKLTLVREVYQKYYQSIELLTDVQLFEFMDRWNRPEPLNYRQATRNSIILGCGKVGAEYSIQVQDAKRANEGEKFNVLILNTDIDYLRMIKELHLTYTLNKLNETILEVVFNEGGV